MTMKSPIARRRPMIKDDFLHASCLPSQIEEMVWKGRSSSITFHARNNRETLNSRKYLHCSALLLFLVFTSFQLTPQISSKRLLSSKNFSTEFQSSFSGKFQVDTPNAPDCTAITSDEISFTLVTQMSVDRLWMMEHHCRRWGSHPISIAVFTNSTVEKIQNHLLDIGCSLEFVTVQTLWKGYSIDDYPVNLLRNMALSSVKTTHFVLLDIDFWPSTSLYETLSSTLVREHFSSDPKTAVVIPAFQLTRQCVQSRECPEYNVPLMPETRSQLLNLLQDRKVTVFDPTNLGGHGSTHYRAWLHSPSTQVMEPINCVLSNRYEPYLVTRYCRDLPPFQIAFSGYGKNKMTWIMQMRRSGYKFYQFQHEYCIHYPHLDSKSRLAWNGGSNGEQLSRPDRNLLQFRRGRVDATFIEFRSWLRMATTDETVVGLCQDALNDDERLWVEYN